MLSKQRAFFRPCPPKCFFSRLAYFFQLFSMGAPCFLERQECDEALLSIYLIYFECCILAIFFVQLWEKHSVHSSCPITVDEGRVKCHTDQSPNPTCITATDDNKKHNNRTNAFKTRARRSNLHCVDIFYI